MRPQFHASLCSSILRAYLHLAEDTQHWCVYMYTHRQEHMQGKRGVRRRADERHAGVPSAVRNETHRDIRTRLGKERQIMTEPDKDR